MTPNVRYRFGEFVVSPRQRLLARQGQPVPLIPKYFDLLVLLVRRREDAVSKATIFEVVWSDVIVSDGALAQAVRTLRRALGDESKAPRFIQTISRHGYRFVFAEVVEEADEGPMLTIPAPPPDAGGQAATAADAMESLLDQLLRGAQGGRDAEADARDVAERLHQLGTAAAVARLTARPRHARALALLRDARWTSPTAGDVPLHGGEGVSAVLQTVALRVRDASGVIVRRWSSAALAASVGGAVAGACGGLLLRALPASPAAAEAPVALAVIGAAAGGLGAAGLGAGITFAEAAARSQRLLALVACGAAATGLVGAFAQLVTRTVLAGLFGLATVPVGGAFDGLVLGSAAGLAYGLATYGTVGGGLAAPVGWRRAGVAFAVAGACALAAAALSLSGRTLVGGLVHQIARASSNAQLGLAPLGRLIGEPDFGTATRALLAAFEGGLLGASTVWGLTIRPRPRRVAPDLTPSS